MNQVVKYIREYYRTAFNRYYFLLILLLLAVLIYLNYWHFLEQRFAQDGNTWWSNFAGQYCIYFIPFAAAFFLQPLFLKGCDNYSNAWFWLILILAPAFFSFRVNFNFQEAITNKVWSGAEAKYWLKCINLIVRVLVLLMLVYITWFIKDKSNQPFYGYKKLYNVKPYLLMLLIMVPLVAAASTQHDFLSMYPKAKFIGRLGLSHQNWRYIVYELCYGFDFVSIEFFFRGFLILSLLKICGNRCIIPIACFYCSIHLGKPMGEAISSFWGGMVLGIVSYNTRSIWGGLLIHLGIAWLMEIGGYLGALL